MMTKYFKEIDILNIELHEGEFGYSEEIADGVIFDISQEGEILSIEVLDVAKKFRKPAVERIDEAAYEGSGDTVMEIPYKLIPIVRDLIAQTSSAEHAKS